MRADGVLRTASAVVAVALVRAALGTAPEAAVVAGEARVAAALPPSTDSVAGAVIGAYDNRAVVPSISLRTRALAKDALSARRALHEEEKKHTAAMVM